MNQKAEEIGACDTHFENASGLPTKEKQYTTARDLTIILKNALTYPLIKEIIGKKQAVVTTAAGKELYIANTDALLWYRSDMVGGKTGFTNSARHCFVGAMDTEKGMVYAAVLGAPSRRRLWKSTQMLAKHVSANPEQVSEVVTVEEVVPAPVKKHKHHNIGEPRTRHRRSRPRQYHRGRSYRSFRYAIELSFVNKPSPHPGRGIPHSELGTKFPCPFPASIVFSLHRKPPLFFESPFRHWRLTVITGQSWMTTLKAIANRDESCIPVDRTIEDAIQQLMAARTGVVVFVEQNKPVGILTERDIVTILHRGLNLQTRLSAIKQPPLTVTDDKTLLFGLNMLIDNNIRRIVVVDPQGCFVGVVTQDDLIKHLEGELFQRNARIMDIISSRQPLRTVSASDSLSAAIEVMTNHMVGSVLVMEHDIIAGILTEKDILKIASNKTSLSEKAGAFMSHPVVTAPIDSSVSTVIDIMKAKNIRRMLITYSDGAPFRVITNRDILRNLENSYFEFLNRKIRHAREVLDFLPEVIVEVIDVSGEQVIQWSNRKTKQTFGSDMANLPITSLVPAATWAPLYPQIVAKGRIEKARVVIGERTFELSASYMKMQREGIIQAILIDITTELKLSTRDFLTGVYNRRMFDEKLNSEIERAKRYGGRLSIGMLDIDHFKSVNDTYGHPVGDKVLQELTRIVGQNLREVDYFARYGGEEFVILAPDTDILGMTRIAQKLRHLIEVHTFTGRLRITVSLGLAQFVEGDTAATFMERSDAALYQAKANGRNRVAL